MIGFEQADRLHCALVKMRELKYEQLRRLGRELNEAYEFLVVDKV